MPPKGWTPNRIEEGDDWGLTMRKLAPCGLCGKYISRLTGCRHWNLLAQRPGISAKKNAKTAKYKKKQRQLGEVCKASDLKAGMEIVRLGKIFIIVEVTLIPISLTQHSVAIVGHYDDAPARRRNFRAAAQENFHLIPKS